MTRNRAHISPQEEPIMATECPVVILLCVICIVTTKMGTLLLQTSSATTIKLKSNNANPPPRHLSTGLQFYLHKSWLHMFIYHSYPFSGTGECQSSSYKLRRCLKYIANIHRNPVSLTIPNDCSNFRGFWRCVLSWYNSGLLRVLLLNAVVLAGLLELGVCLKSLNRARGDHLRLKIVVRYDQHKFNSEPTLKSLRHYITLLLDPLHLLIRPVRLKSHPGLEKDCNTSSIFASKEADCWVDESDEDVSSYLKQFYNSSAGGWHTFRPQFAQVSVAPVQCYFLPNPTLNPSIDLAFTGYRIATLGAVPASFPVSLSRLAEAGFYFRGEGDEMVCYSCGAHYSGWTRGDDPMAVHRTLAPHCRHVVAKDREAQSLGRGATNAPQSTAPVMVVDGLGGGQSSHQLPPFAALSLSSSSSSQSAASSTGGQGVTITGASLDGRITSRTTDTARSSLESTGVSMDGQSSGRQPTVITGSSSAFQPVGSAMGNHTSSRMVVSRTVPESSTIPLSDGASETHLFPRAALDLGQAVYPMYQDTASRRRSFEQCRWDSTRAPPLDEVIMSGMFYAGYDDCVRCFYCGVGLKHWMPSDDVWKEHARWRPHCGYLRTVRTEEFIRNMQRQLDAAGSGGTQNSATPGSTLQAASPARETPVSTNATTATITISTTSSTVAPDSAARQAAATAAAAAVEPTASVPQTQSFNALATGRASVTTSGTSSPVSQTVTRQGLSSQTQSSNIPPPGAPATPGSQTTSQASAPIPQTQTRSMPSSNTSNAGTTASSSATADGSPATPAREQETPHGSCVPSQTAGTEGRRRGAVAQAAGTDGLGGAGDGAPGNQRAADNLERRDRLQEENHRLSQRFQCRVCQQARVNCIFLPCGHLITCETCSQLLVTCPQCRAAIRATARVHMA